MTPSATNKTADIFGLREDDVEKIIAVLQQHEEVEEAVIFGSRAKGNYKNGSDVDIALKGSRLTWNITSDISDVLNEETQMPYKFDVLNYHNITNKDLAGHIDKIGISFYKRI